MPEPGGSAGTQKGHRVPYTVVRHIQTGEGSRDGHAAKCTQDSDTAQPRPRRELGDGDPRRREVRGELRDRRDTGAREAVQARAVPLSEVREEMRQGRPQAGGRERVAGAGPRRGAGVPDVPAAAHQVPRARRDQRAAAVDGRDEPLHRRVQRRGGVARMPDVQDRGVVLPRDKLAHRRQLREGGPRQDRAGRLGQAALRAEGHMRGRNELLEGAPLRHRRLRHGPQQGRVGARQARQVRLRGVLQGAHGGGARGRRGRGRRRGPLDRRLRLRVLPRRRPLRRFLPCGGMGQRRPRQGQALGGGEGEEGVRGQEGRARGRGGGGRAGLRAGPAREGRGAGRARRHAEARAPEQEEARAARPHRRARRGGVRARRRPRPEGAGQAEEGGAAHARAPARARRAGGRGQGDQGREARARAQPREQDGQPGPDDRAHRGRAAGPLGGLPAQGAAEAHPAHARRRRGRLPARRVDRGRLVLRPRADGEAGGEDGAPSREHPELRAPVGQQRQGRVVQHHDKGAGEDGARLQESRQHDRAHIPEVLGSGRAAAQPTTAVGGMAEEEEGRGKRAPARRRSCVESK